MIAFYHTVENMVKMISSITTNLPKYNCGIERRKEMLLGRSSVTKSNIPIFYYIK